MSLSLISTVTTLAEKVVQEEVTKNVGLNALRSMIKPTTLLTASTGVLAAEVTGCICDKYDVDEANKRICKASTCLVVGGATAYITKDLVGGTVVALESVMYATGHSPAEFIPIPALISSLLLFTEK